MKEASFPKGHIPCVEACLVYSIKMGRKYITKKEDLHLSLRERRVVEIAGRSLSGLCKVA